MLCSRRCVFVCGGPLIPRRGAWLGLKPFPADHEHNREEFARKAFLAQAPVAGVFVYIHMVSRLANDSNSNSLEGVERWLFLMGNVSMSLTEIAAFVLILMISLRLIPADRDALYIIYFLLFGLYQVLEALVLPPNSSSKITRMILLFPCVMALQVVMFEKKISLGLTGLPLFGQSLYAIRCWWRQADLLQWNDSFQGQEIVLMVLVFVLSSILWLVSRGVSLGRAGLGLPIGQHYNLPGPTIIGPDAQASADSNSFVQSEGQGATLPTRRDAKEALLALYVLSRSAWGPNGQSLPPHLYTRVAYCLGRQHYTRFWREELSRMKEMRTPWSHGRLEALVEALRRGEAPNDGLSEVSCASSAGSLTRMWNKLHRMFSSEMRQGDGNAAKVRWRL
eukprot:TRINITY_DN13754_c0_g2_i1.p1 TRINITY_DN13754_c0_g2~~TRINITY_DN13754_c0_g2_i1.p1  ORF type:complete len:393 (-),score=22.81 TRINITY_DN13754_c0_g2_i1:197-1375(-)